MIVARYSGDPATDKPGPLTASGGVWTIAALRALEWKRFDVVLTKYYALLAMEAITLRCRSDGGTDMLLTKPGGEYALAVLQCKAWTARSIGVDKVQGLLELMRETRSDRGLFVTTGTYTQDALDFAVAQGVHLLDGYDMLGKILALPQAQQDALLSCAFEGDYTTPSCPTCGIKTRHRASKRGPFWACPNYRRCQTTFAMRTPVVAQGGLYTSSILLE
jgi:restriction system protein